MIHRIKDMGREDVVKVLQAGCSIYRIITLEESMSLPAVAALAEADDSLQIQQEQLNGNPVVVTPPDVITSVAE